MTPPAIVSSKLIAGQNQRLVFLGAGHAHLYSIKRAGEFTRRGFDVVVISPEDFWYSGLATGMLGARYAPEQDQVDIPALLHHGGRQATFIRSRAIALDVQAKCLHLENGTSVSYDVLSLNLGSETHPLPGGDDGVYPIKPLRNLWRLREALEARAVADKQFRVLIAGGGTSGCEIAANIRALLGKQAEITLLAKGGAVAPSLSSGAQAALAAWLREHQIRFHPHSAVKSLEKSVAVTNNGARFGFDFLVNATGLHPPRLIADSGLATGERGDLLVNRFLQSTSEPTIFGGGDCVRFQERDLARIGVYAVREAPVLFHNLVAFLEGRSLRPFHPQRNYLLILNLGGGIGLACWRDWHWLGRTAFWLKDRIDRTFLARYRREK